MHGLSCPDCALILGGNLYTDYVKKHYKPAREKADIDFMNERAWTKLTGRQKYTVILKHITKMYHDRFKVHHEALENQGYIVPPFVPGAPEIKKEMEKEIKNEEKELNIINKDEEELDKKIRAVNFELEVRKDTLKRDRKSRGEDSEVAIARKNRLKNAVLEQETKLAELLIIRDKKNIELGKQINLKAKKISAKQREEYRRMADEKEAIEAQQQRELEQARVDAVKKSKNKREPPLNADQIKNILGNISINPQIFTREQLKGKGPLPL